ncbi:hypothetical protein SAMN05444680_103486 [Variovorax sp. YR216]|nr:hypothetical protein SAMN05444680_103486 [Variovorax sp. YR216]
MKRVWEQSQHSGAHLLMMLAIADFADDQGRAYPAVGTLAGKCRVKPRAANYTIADLRDSGELEVKVGCGPRGANLYRILLDRLGARRNAGAPLQSSAPLNRVAPSQSTAGVQPGAVLQSSAPLQPGARAPALECTNPLQPGADKPSLNRQEPSIEESVDSSVGAAGATPSCPHGELLDLYAKHLPMLPQPRRGLWANSTAAREMTARWRQMLTAKKDDGAPYASTKAEAIEWFDSFFAHAAKSDFLTGRNGKWSGCDIGWLMRSGNFNKVVAGNYDNRVAEVTR